MEATTNPQRATTGPTTPSVTNTAVQIPQLSQAGILGVWLAATAPMGIAAWVVAPRIADSFGDQGMLKALLVTLTAGLIWQFVLVVGLIGREQGTLRWSVVREALWLNRPVSPKSGRRGGRVWFAAVPAIVLLAAGQAIPMLPHSAERDFGAILETDAGQAFFNGNWTWFAVAVTLFVFNTALGEELLFRGYLLPRMEGAFGDRAWMANGVLFAGYHVHVPWVIPMVLLITTPALAYASQRYRSAWMGIIVHSVQTIVLVMLLLALVVQ